MREAYSSNKTSKYYQKAIAEIEGKIVIVYDFETTGLSPKTEKWIQLSARKCQVNGGRLEELEDRVWYVNPNRVLSQVIIDLTGITNEFLADKPTEDEVFAEISGFFGDNIIMGYNNRRFDDEFMNEYYKRCRSEFNSALSLDCFELVTSVVRADETKNKKLQTITEYLDLQDQVSQFHNAEGDTKATMLVFNELIERVETTAEVPDNLIHCTVMSVSNWQSPHKKSMRRIYVTTNRTDLYMDCVDKNWYLKDENDRIHRYDVEDIINQVMRLTNCTTQDELARWKGRLYA